MGRFHLLRNEKAAKFGLRPEAMSAVASRLRAVYTAPRPARHTPDTCLSRLFCATRRTGKPAGLGRRRVLGGRGNIGYPASAPQSRLGARLLPPLTIRAGESPLTLFAASIRTATVPEKDWVISDVRRVRIEYTGVTTWECTAQIKNSAGRLRLMLYWAVWDEKRQLLHRVCISAPDSATLRAYRDAITAFLERWTRTLTNISAATVALPAFLTTR